MREWLFVFLFGSIGLTSLFLIAFWWKFGHKRRVELLGEVLKDQYWLLATAITLNGIGLTAVALGRLSGALVYGLSPRIGSFDLTAVLGGLVVLLASQAVMVYLADLQKEPPVWTWLKWMAVVIVFWAIFAFVVSDNLPVWQPDRPVERSVLNVL